MLNSLMYHLFLLLFFSACCISCTGKSNPSGEKPHRDDDSFSEDISTVNSDSDVHGMEEDGGEITPGAENTNPKETDTENSATESTDTDQLKFVSIKTAMGPIKGAIDENARVFKNIPYAHAPIGMLRFKPPVAANPWTTELDGTEFGSICPQALLMTNTMDGDEDCLNMNVWTPSILSDKPLPVMVWLHGGAFKYGSGSESMYNAKHLASEAGVVVVTFNYRIGMLGFFSHEALAQEDQYLPSSGNYGLMDQQLALRWVRDNIADYGGDPDNVTIFGQSAGAISAGIHLVLPTSRDLFRRAIIQSGPVNLFEYQSAEEAQSRGASVAEKLGCGEAVNVLQCLRDIPAMDFVQYTTDIIEDPGGLLLQDVDAENIWTPSIDGLFLQEDPIDTLKRGNLPPVPVLIGSTKDEGNLFLSFVMNPVDVTNEAEYSEMLQRRFQERANEIASRYPVSDFETPNDAAARVTGDAFFTSQTRQMAQLLTQAGFKSYVYRFDRDLNGLLTNSLKATHAAEIMFVFGMDNALGTIEEEGRALSDAMIGYWTDFAAFGDPNRNAIVEWPVWENSTEPHLILDLKIEAEEDFNSDLSEFWQDILL